MEIELKLIRTDGGTQPREKLDMFVVDDYAQAMQEGAQFPPLTVFYDGQTYWLADGYHRYHAIRQLGWSKATIEVRQGTRREAVLYSCGANASHGMRRTNQDKRRAVITLLGDSEWQRWSDREIARRCVVTHTFIANLRREQGGSFRPAATSQPTQAPLLSPPVSHTTVSSVLPVYEPLATVASGSYTGNDCVTELTKTNALNETDKLPRPTPVREKIQSGSPGSESEEISPPTATQSIQTPAVPLKSTDGPEIEKAGQERVYISKYGALSVMRLPPRSTPTPDLLTNQSPQSAAVEPEYLPPNFETAADFGFGEVSIPEITPVSPGLPVLMRRQLADTPIREQPGELARLAKLNPTDQTKVVGLLTQSYQATNAKPLTVQKALSQHRHEQAEASRLAALAGCSSKPGALDGGIGIGNPPQVVSSGDSTQVNTLTNPQSPDAHENELWTVTAEQAVVECEMVLTDPPYGILKGVDWEPQEVSHLEEFSREWATRWGKQSGAGVIAIFWSEDHLFEGKRWFDESLPDYDFQQLLIWHFPNTLKPIGRGYFRNSFDPIFIYRRKGTTPPSAVSTNWPTGVTQSDCHVAAIPQSNYLEVDRKFHPAQKPLSVALWLLSILSGPGDRVADPFCGSGTFGVAAVQLGRLYHGIETNEEYQKLARHRITTYGLTEVLARKPQATRQSRFEAI